VDKNTPTTFELSQNHSNPFTIIIRFSIFTSTFGTLKAYNLPEKEATTSVSDNLETWNFISLKK